MHTSRNISPQQAAGWDVFARVDSMATTPALLAEMWFQSLRAWRTKVVYLPRPGHRKSYTVNIRRPGRCAVCRAARVLEYEAQFALAISSGRNPKPVIRAIAAELGVRPVAVERHFAQHVVYSPPQPLVGEWASGGVDYVETPIGWVLASELMRAIRDSPESGLLLAAIRRGRRKTLLDRGYFRDEKSKRIGQALLQIHEALTLPAVQVIFSLE